MYVAVGEVNTSVRNVGFAARSRACCANTSVLTLMSGHTIVSTAISPLRQKVRTMQLNKSLLNAVHACMIFHLPCLLIISAASYKRQQM